MPRIRCIRAARTARRRRLIDARTLADLLARQADPCAGARRLRAGARCEPTANIVRTNREHPPDFINIQVEELTGDRPFDNLDNYISQDELRAMSEDYKRVAGYADADLG